MRQIRILMAAEPTRRCPAGGQGADPVGQQQRWSVDGSCRLVVSVGHYVGVIPERTSSTGWLIPGALAFLAVSIAFAAVMLVWHGGTGGGVPAAGGPTAGGSVPAGPGGTPTPAGGAAASSSPGGAARTARRCRSTAVTAATRNRGPYRPTARCRRWASVWTSATVRRPTGRRCSCMPATEPGRRCGGHNPTGPCSTPGPADVSTMPDPARLEHS